MVHNVAMMWIFHNDRLVISLQERVMKLLISTKMVMHQQHILHLRLTLPNTIIPLSVSSSYN
jgi:hypothetical protein